MKNKKRLLCGIIAVLLVFTFTFSFLFVIQETNHNCCGAGCRVCLAISHCFELICSAKVAFCLLLIVSLSLFTVSFYQSRLKKSDFCSNLVTLKTKLSI